MKKTLKILGLLLMLCMLPLAAQAEDLQQILLSEAWTGMDTNSGHFAFEQGGTGTLSFAGDFVVPMTWSMEGNAVSLSYELYGTRMASYALEQTDGIWGLKFQGEGSGVLLRVSDRDAMLAADREAVNAFPAEMGQQLRLGFVNLTLEKMDVNKKLDLSDGVSVNASSGNQYVGIICTIENPGTQGINAGNIRSEFMFDDQYIYTGSITLQTNNLSDKTVKPLERLKLYMMAQVPDTMAEGFSTCTITFSFDQQMKEMPLKVSQGDFIFRVEVGQETAAEAKKREVSCFEYCPALPDPTSFYDVMQSGSNVSKTNKKITRIVFRYRPYDSNQDVAQIMKGYLSELEKLGFTVKNNAVYAEGIHLAEVSVDGKTLEVNITPGNEGMTALPSAASGQVAAAPAYLSIGDTLEATSAEMTLEDYGKTDKIYSSITKSGSYTYYYSQTGNPYFYLFGHFTNAGKVPVDIRNIYAELIFDDQYRYSANVAGVQKGASSFINDVASRTRIGYYVYGEVPSEVLDSYKTCVVRLGFTDDYGLKISSAGGLYNFEHCRDVREILIER